MGAKRVTYMLNIITDKTDKKCINDVEIAFNKSIQLGIKDVPLYAEVLKVIDKSQLIGDDTVKTPFGITSLSNISSGSKCLLLALSNDKVYVNFDEAGNNVLELANKMAVDRNINIYMSNRRPIPGKNNAITINGKKSTVYDWR